MTEPNLPGLPEPPKRKREEPTIQKFGNHYRITSGRWHDDCVTKWLIVKSLLVWVDVGDLARIVQGQNVPKTRAYVRSHLTGLKKASVKRHGWMILVDYSGPHGQAVRVKIYDPTNASEEEKRIMKDQLLKMKERNDEMYEHYQRCSGLVNGG